MILVLELGLSGGFLAPPARALVDNVSGYRLAWTLARDGRVRDDAVEAARRAQRASYGLPPEVVAALHQGTVDVAPWDIAIVDAYALAWDPRPVLQSYSAYRPYLDERDARHYSGRIAPDHVLLANEAIDGRHLAFDEPATFRSLLSAYTALPQPAARFVVLSRRPFAVPTSTPAGTRCSALGREIQVPRLPGHQVFARLPEPQPGGLPQGAGPPTRVRIHPVPSRG